MARSATSASRAIRFRPCTDYPLACAFSCNRGGSTMECVPPERRAMKTFSYVSSLIWLLAGLCAAAEVDEPTEADWQTIQGVITSQLEAFKRDDAATAFSFASPAIQQMFHTPGEFMQM